MRIRIKKGRDGPPALACVRDDGSRTWTRVHAFFPVHDLTHCAVESVLELREAFFGLVSRGWDIEDFAAPGAAGTMPAEALWAEQIVGLLDQERATGRMWNAVELNEAVGAAALREVTDAELQAIRALRGGLSARWSALAPGESLDVTFPVLLEQ